MTKAFSLNFSNCLQFSVSYSSRNKYYQLKTPAECTHSFVKMFCQELICAIKLPREKYRYSHLKKRMCFPFKVTEKCRNGRTTDIKNRAISSRNHRCVCWFEQKIWNGNPKLLWMVKSQMKTIESNINQVWFIFFSTQNGQQWCLAA